MEFCKVRYSVLSCLLFIQDMISAHNLDCMFYEDDSQLYITVDPLDQRPALNTLQKKIQKKIEFIQFSSRFVKNPILSDFLIGNSRVQPSDRRCNLGVSLGRELNVSHHGNGTCKKAMLAIQVIGRLRKYLSKDHLNKMVNAFFMSRLDYCSSLYCV